MVNILLGIIFIVVLVFLYKYRNSSLSANFLNYLVYGTGDPREFLGLKSYTSEKFIDYPKFEKLTENEKPINYSVYEIKDPKRYINARVFNPGSDKEYSLLGNFEKNEKLPPDCKPPYKLPKNPWE